MYNDGTDQFDLVFLFFETDPRPDKPPVVIKVKDTAKRKLEFDQVSKSGLRKNI